MNSTASADVVLVAWTHFAPPADAELVAAIGTRWRSDADGATFYVTGVSRSLTHELIRHLSVSQLSQRYVPSGDAVMVEPDAIAGDPELHRIFTAATDASLTRAAKAVAVATGSVFG